MKKTLSIIIPMYWVSNDDVKNRFECLIESIAVNYSALRDDITISEIVCINDSPEDRLYRQTVDSIFRKWNLLEKLISIQLSSNSGQARARNVGALRSTGQYLHFIDQDDFISENFYNEMLCFSSDFVLSHIQIFGECADRSIEYLKPRLVAKLTKSSSLAQLKFLLIGHIAFSTGQFLVKRRAYDLVGGFPELKMRGTDDYGFIYNLCFASVSFAYAEQACFFYRMHSTQSKNKLDMLGSLREFFFQHASHAMSLSYYLIRSFKISPVMNIAAVCLSRLLYFYKIPIEMRK